MVQVAPSILAADFANLERDCRRVITAENPMLHFDVMDGVFVPNLSFGIPVLQSLKKAIPEAVYDVHLMICDPLRYVADFAAAGADCITFHIEANSDPVGTIKAIHAAGAKAGISLRPGTPVKELRGLLALADRVLVMSVEPGFGGQSFMAQALERIGALRAMAQELGTMLEIEVDGGIDTGTGPACVRAGADILVAGSAVFGAENPAEVVNALKHA